MDNEKYKSKGLSGLQNLGNTCFMNSCMQVLSHTYELNNLLNDNNYKKKLREKNETVLLLEWDNLRQLMWSENCVILPGRFLNTIHHLARVKGCELFTGFEQNDTAEFLMFVIDCFHTSLAREVTMEIEGVPQNEIDKIAIKCFEMIKNMYNKEYSEIWNIFYGVHVSQISSLETGELLSFTPEPYFMINLSIPENNKSPTLIDCFDLYVKGEEMVGENAWYDKDPLLKQDVKKNITFWSFPNVLVIDIKRFNRFNHNNKNQILVDFPLTNLDLRKYAIGYKKDSYVYDLYGICNHSGGVHGGHYTSFVKNANYKWYHFNDNCVTEVKNESDLITSKAYCLFYRII